MACSCGCEFSRVTIVPTGKTRLCRDCGLPLVPEAVVVAAPPVAAAKAVAPTPKSAPLTARDILHEAKREAKSLRASIRANERALAADRKRLAAITRLLDAAEARPRAVVRPIRTTA